MSSLIKGPLGGAAAVRELTGGERAPFAQFTRAEIAHRLAGLAGPADVENDGDRGPRASRDAAPAIGELRCVRLQKLDAATADLDASSLDVLLWIASQLPAAKLRAACEQATATGWVARGAKDNPAQRTEVDGARAALLAAVRAIEPLVGAPRTVRRDRDDVLADEAARRAGGAK